MQTLLCQASYPGEYFPCAQISMSVDLLIQIMSVSFLGGAFLGSLLQGWVSPRYGRRGATAVAAATLIISGACMAGSVHVAMFTLFRILSGVGAGILTSNTPTYISEIAPIHSRGLLVATHGVTINLSYTLSSLFAFGFNFVPHPYQWRLQFIVFTFCSIVLLVSVHYLPESPRWLVVSWKLLPRLHSRAPSQAGY